MERFSNYSRLLATGAPAPLATITVYNVGTLVLATIYSDNGVTPQANPFLTDSDGFFAFYAAGGDYDVKISGGGIPTPYTWGAKHLSGFTSLNGLSGDALTLAVGSAGTDFAIVAAGTTITFNLPSASAANRGLVTTGAQTFAGVKTFSTPIAINSGGTGLSTPPADGGLLIGSGGGTSWVNSFLLGTANQINVALAAGSITLSTPQNINSGASPTFSGLTLSSMTQNATAIFGAGGIFTSVGPGNSGQLLIGSTGNPPVWASLIAGANITLTPGPGSLTIAALAGISSLNGLTGATQTFAVGTAGADFNIVSGGTVHTFNIPDAGAGARGAVTTLAQTFAGLKTFSTPPQYKAGTSVTSAIVSGQITSSGSAFSNAGTAETDLGSFSLPANVLSANGKLIRLTAWGSFAANGNTKVVRAYFGASTITLINGAHNNLAWKVVVEVLRTGAATQLMNGIGQVSTVAPTVLNTSPTETLAGAITVKLTGQGGAGSDITEIAFDIEVVG